MASPGSDFLASLNSLFREAGSSGRDAKIEFAHLRGVLIDLVSSCGQMGAAKVRASSRLKFIDDTQPNTMLVLPPARLHVDDKARALLEATATGGEFVKTLREMITKQLSPRRSPRGRKSKSPVQQMFTGSPKSKNKSPVQTLTGSPKSKVQRRIEAAIRKGGKRVVRLKLRRSGERLDADDDKQQVRARNRRPLANKKAEPPVIAQEAEASTSASPMDIDTNRAASNEQGDSTNIESDESSSQNDISSNSFDSEGDAQMEDAVVPKTEETPENEWPPAIPATPERKPDIRELAAAIKKVGEDGWAEAKPQLLEMLTKMGVSDEPEKPPTPESIKAALRRLANAVKKLEPERAHIPEEAWNKYHAKLVKEARAGWFDKRWEDRLWRVTRVCYLKEEEVVVPTRDWDRLRAAARMCAIIVELTAPPHLFAAEQKENGEWLVEKLNDISFLERLFDAKERAAAIVGPGEYNWTGKC